MKSSSNDIVLRPRFQFEFNSSKETFLAAFEAAEEQDILVNRIDDHVFIKFKKKHVHFWSPQLHIEINEIDGQNCKLYGLFGPNPSLWTFFMFLHFGCATLFLIFGVWAYSNSSLERPIGLQVGLMTFMVVIWFSLYAFGRMGKNKGRPQMNELYRFMKDALPD